MFVGHEPDFSTMIRGTHGRSGGHGKTGRRARVDLEDAAQTRGELRW